MNNDPTYRVDCPFCHMPHEGPYADEIQAQVMACRERVAPHHQGRLEDWDFSTMPRPCTPELRYDGTWLGQT